MRNWTIRRRIQASFAAVILVTGAMGAFAYAELDRIDSQAQAARDDFLPELSNSSRLLARLNENFSITQEIAIQQESAQFNQLASEIKENRSSIDALLQKYGMMTAGGEADRLQNVENLLG